MQESNFKAPGYLKRGWFAVMLVVTANRPQGEWGMVVLVG